MGLKLRDLVLRLMGIAMATPAAAQGIHILSANYGNPSTGALCDAAAAIAAICEGQSQCSFNVRNTALCGDPSFLVVKQLHITYTCGVGKYNTAVSEYDVSVLACR